MATSIAPAAEPRRNWPNRQGKIAEVNANLQAHCGQRHRPRAADDTRRGACHASHGRYSSAGTAVRHASGGRAARPRADSDPDPLRDGDATYVPAHGRCVDGRVRSSMCRRVPFRSACDRRRFAAAGVQRVRRRPDRAGRGSPLSLAMGARAAPRSRESSRRSARSPRRAGGWSRLFAPAEFFAALFRLAVAAEDQRLRALPSAPATG